MANAARSHPAAVTPAAPARIAAVAALLLAFLLSGASTLVYEILWTRVVSTTFGVTAHAIATILSAFMAGIALGSLLGGRMASRLGSARAALRAYAVVEVAVALTALGVQAVLEASGGLMGWISLTFPGTGPVALAVRFLCLGALLLPPTVLMGATLPLFVQGFARLVPHPHRAITVAYGVNVLGAALGCYAAAFFLLSELGVQRSVALAAALNLAAAALAAIASRVAAHPDGLPAPEPPSDPLPIDDRVLYGLVAATGTTTLVAEVVWSRVYRQAFQLANPFKGFALVLTVILVGMALGSLFAAVRRLDARRALALFGRLQLALGATAWWGIGQVRIAAVDTLQVGDNARLALIAASLLVSAMLAGACFPTMGSVLARAPATLGARLGGLSFASTAGGVLGSLLGGFVLLPGLGTRGSLLLVSGLAVVSGWVALRHGVWAKDAQAPAAKRADGVAFALLVLVGWVGFVTADRPDFPPPPAHELVWMDDGLEATTVVLRNHREHANVLYTNGIGIEARSQLSRVGLPMLLAPRHDRVLLIGFGTGSSAKHLLEHYPDVRVDCVELDGNQVASARFFGNEDVLDNPRFHLVVDDGRQYFLRNPGAWDLILVDSFGQDVNQEFYGVGFYEAARRALAEDGTFFIKLPSNSLTRPEDVDVVLRSAAAAFPFAWLALTEEKGATNGIVGRATPLSSPAERHAAAPAAVRELFDVDTLVSGLRPLDAGVLARLGSTRLNTDDQPWFFEHRGTPEEEAATWRYMLEITTAP